MNNYKKWVLYCDSWRNKQYTWLKNNVIDIKKFTLIIWNQNFTYIALTISFGNWSSEHLFILNIYTLVLVLKLLINYCFTCFPFILFKYNWIVNLAFEWKCSCFVKLFNTLFTFTIDLHFLLCSSWQPIFLF